MGVRKPHALRREPVYVGSRNFTALGVVTSHIAVPEVIGKDDHDVRACGVGTARVRGNATETSENKNSEYAFHNVFRFLFLTAFLLATAPESVFPVAGLSSARAAARRCRAALLARVSSAGATGFSTKGASLMS